MAKDSELKVEIENEELVLRVGISALCMAVRQCQIIYNAVMDANGDEAAVEITDEAVFAKEILSALMVEEEDGSTLVHQMLDSAAECAIEQGCEGIEFHKTKDEDDS